MFDSLLAITPTSSQELDELQRYLAMDVEDVKDALMWWYERRTAFPRLSRMARDYLSIPGKFYFSISWSLSLITFLIATTVDVERVFSHGRLILPHVRSRLAVQSTHASLCVGIWSALGLVRDGDIKTVLGPELEEENELPVDWDAICGS